MTLPTSRECLEVIDTASGGGGGEEWNADRDYSTHNYLII